MSKNTRSNKQLKLLKIEINISKKIKRRGGDSGHSMAMAATGLRPRGHAHRLLLSIIYRYLPFSIYTQTKQLNKVRDKLGEVKLSILHNLFSHLFVYMILSYLSTLWFSHWFLGANEKNARSKSFTSKMGREGFKSPCFFLKKN